MVDLTKTTQQVLYDDVVDKKLPRAGLKTLLDEMLSAIDGRADARITVVTIDADATLTTSALGKLHQVTAAATLTLPAAATAADKFFFWVQTNGGAATLAADDDINGSADDYVIADGRWAIIRCDGTEWTVVDWATGSSASVGSTTPGLFTKADHTVPLFTKTGAGTAETQTALDVEVDGTVLTIASGTSVTMPGSFTAGTDYAVWVHPDGTVEATDDHDTAPVTGARKVGGFHYAPGGNATAFNTGGNTTPQINEYSFWDLKFRPTCPDPRGMVLVADSFWCDIYLLGVNHHVDGTSAYNVTIADGSSPPKVPAMFGGDGSADYGGFTSFEAREVMAAHGKQLLSYDEFMAAAYGSDEAADGSTDPVSTILREAFTSIWGVMLATGNMWVWGREFGGPDSGASWNSSTEGRGSVYNQPNAALFGGYWADGSYAGSRASNWNVAPWHSVADVGARGRSDHLCHV